MRVEEGLRKVKLGELNAGMLFKYYDTVAIKSEYKNIKGGFECFIVGSGEMFWGGTTNSEALNNLMVMPLWIKE